jgi:molybdopterin-guanine dinucleotide biosynthesis protein A
MGTGCAVMRGRAHRDARRLAGRGLAGRWRCAYGQCVRYEAIVLAGGDSRRLDGADKPALVIGGSTMLERVIAACSGADRTVVVGPQRPGISGVLWCQESPPGGGPVAALAAALPLVQTPVVLTLAADLPFVGPAVSVLLERLGDAEVAVLLDVGGRRNLLAAAWRTSALRERLAYLEPVGLPVRALFAEAEVADVVDDLGWGRDCDTWPEVAAARATVATPAEAAPDAAIHAPTEERMP